MTYENVLESMVSEYQSICGLLPREGSDLMIRLRTVAAAVWAVHCRADELEKQCSLLTATGEALDNFAALAGITRKQPVQPGGILHFFTPEPLSSPLVIPAGKVCRSAADPSLYAVTVEDGVIAAGESTVNIPAQVPGQHYDSYPQLTFSVPDDIGTQRLGVTSTDFSGGCPGEDDGQLRTRLIKALRGAPNGLNTEYYESIVRELPCVRDAVATWNQATGSVNVSYIPSGVLNAAQTADAVEALLAEKGIFGHQIELTAVPTENYDITVVGTLANGISANEAENTIWEKINEYTAEKALGEPLTAPQAYSLIDSLGLFDEFTIETPDLPKYPGAGMVLYCGIAMVTERS